mgnify:CR=1 FL=1
MSQSLDPIQIARMPFTARNQAVMQLLQTLIHMKPEDAKAVLQQLLQIMTTKATDEEYMNLCESIIRALSQFDVDTIKAVVSLRMQAVSSLSKQQQERDSKILNAVIQSLDQPIREKLMSAMK